MSERTITERLSHPILNDDRFAWSCLRRPLVKGGYVNAKETP